MTSALKRRALFARFRGGPPQLRPPWAKAENDFTEACTQCGKCVAACPTGLVGTGHAGYPIVDFANAHCTFCGSCAAACAEGCFVTSREGRPWHLGARISKACVETEGCHLPHVRGGLRCLRDQVQSAPRRRLDGVRPPRRLHRLRGLRRNLSGARHFHRRNEPSLGGYLMNICGVLVHANPGKLESSLNGARCDCRGSRCTSAPTAGGWSSRSRTPIVRRHSTP